MRRLLATAPRLLLAAALLGAAACSGSSGGQDTTAPAGGGEPTPGGGETTPEEDAERKLRAAQDSAVEAMCERLTDCAVEDARREMSPEELAKLNLEELVPMHRAECEEQYGQKSLSPRQIKIIQGCVNDAGDCDALHECLAAAGKKE